MRILYLVVLLCLPMCLPVVAQAQTDLEVSLVKRIFAVQQLKSFEANREYCGYLYIDRRGKLVGGPVAVGTHTSCLPLSPQGRIVASWHTHGNADPEAWSETPSVQDMVSDIHENVGGYVGTPGGRLWYIDSGQERTWQICGIGCLPADPSFRRGPPGRVRPSYTLPELRIREEG